MEKKIRANNLVPKKFLQRQSSRKKSPPPTPPHHFSNGPPLTTINAGMNFTLFDLDTMFYKYKQ
jgi:hypothetical protein